MRALFAFCAVLAAAVMGVILAAGATATQGGRDGMGIAFLICGVCTVGALLSGKGRSDL